LNVNYEGVSYSQKEIKTPSIIFLLQLKMENRISLSMISMDIDSVLTEVFLQKSCLKWQNQ
jgi:hypothetical protein